ncbi:uncharacterized protein [Littorina saxatilis]|uniref:MYND-type domain-containing protein n=1 Tax=Littorina saxatilis TaxID=31220 RepID=A0AAN9C0R9_9CAEN
MADPKAIFEDDDASKTKGDVLDAQPACLKCGQIHRMMKCCTRCHSAYYCSRPCFVQHWPIHKHSCHPKERISEEITHCETEVLEMQEKKTLYKIVQRDKALTASSPRINFQKAADALSDKKPDKAQVQEPENDAILPGQEITLRYNKEKHKFKVCDAWEAQTIFRKMSSFLSCIPDNMRVIHKGKQLSVDTVRSAVSRGAVFQVLGEKMENEEGLVTKDVELLMQQMGLERNTAVKALRQSKGVLIDAIMTVGNK